LSDEKGPSLTPQLLRAREQVRARVPVRLLDHLGQQRAQRLPERRPGRIAERDQIGARDGKVAETMRARLLGLDEAPERRELGQLLFGRRLTGAPLSAQIGGLVVEQVERELVAVAREQAPRARRVAAGTEHVMPHDLHDSSLELGRVAQPQQCFACELGAHLRVRPVRQARARVVVKPAVSSPPRDGRFSRVVKQCSEPYAERHARRGGGLDDHECVLVEGQAVVVALLVEADRRCELRQHGDEDSGVARQPQRLRRLRPKEQLRQLAETVGRKTAADALTRDEPDARRLRAHLPQCLLVGIDVELGHEPQPANEAKRILGEARRGDGAQDATLQVLAAAERVDEGSVGEPPRHRVDREVAPR
jgi:hypothetical protein